MARSDRRAEFAPRFDGRETLDGLLELAGSSLDAEGVLGRFREAVSAARPRGDVIPTLFPTEPRFPDPALAKKLYENLFGLWELVAAGKPVRLDAPQKPPKPLPAQPPGPFGAEPEATWVESAWQYLEGLDERGMERLEHAFENRQDGLWVFLEEAGLSDAAHLQARTLLFELWAMLELGWPFGLRGVTPGALRTEGVAEVPEAMLAYASEALFEAQQDEVDPLSADDAAKARRTVEAGLAALWAARNRALES